RSWPSPSASTGRADRAGCPAPAASAGGGRGELVDGWQLERVDGDRLEGRLGLDGRAQQGDGEQGEDPDRGEREADPAADDPRPGRRLTVEPPARRLDLAPH